MDYDIVPSFGHYEIYINGKFYCSVDSWLEAEMEIASYQKENIGLGV